MKKILENFRRFTNESDEAIDLPDVGKVALYHDKQSDNQQLILYYMSSLRGAGPFVFAASGIDQLSVAGDNPCIPETYQMSWIFTHPNFRGEGWSKIMYGISFFLVNRLGIGLTSDHWSSTSKKAKDRSWDKLVSRGQLTPRKTPFGNTEFDYDGTTPDPFDDCEKPGDGGDGATNASWMMKDYSAFASLYRKLTEKHESLMSSVDDRKQVEKDLEDQAANKFEKYYKT
jgi:hypothetical protein